MAEPIQFVDEQERIYFSEARLGEEIRIFLGSQVGRYLHGCAKLEIESLRDEMEKIDPDSIFTRLFHRRKLRRLQKRAEAARYFMRWCAEAIEDGDFAARQIETYRDEGS